MAFLSQNVAGLQSGVNLSQQKVNNRPVMTRLRRWQGRLDLHKFTVVPNTVIADQSLRPNEKAMFNLICSMMRDGEVQVGKPYLAKKHGCSRRWATELTGRVVAKGWLEEVPQFDPERGDQIESLYRLPGQRLETEEVCPPTPMNDRSPQVLVGTLSTNTKTPRPSASPVAPAPISPFKLQNENDGLKTEVRWTKGRLAGALEQAEFWRLKWQHSEESNKFIRRYCQRGEQIAVGKISRSKQAEWDARRPIEARAGTWDESTRARAQAWAETEQQERLEVSERPTLPPARPPCRERVLSRRERDSLQGWAWFDERIREDGEAIANGKVCRTDEEFQNAMRTLLPRMTSGPGGIVLAPAIATVHG